MERRTVAGILLVAVLLLAGVLAVVVRREPTPFVQAPTPTHTRTAEPSPTATTTTTPSASLTSQPTSTVTPSPTATRTPTTTPTATPSRTPSGTPTVVPTILPTDEAVVLVGAGDIAACDSPGDEATANLLDDLPGVVFTAGDNAYPSGTATQFADCYEPSWGRHKARTRPAPGNHDYGTPGAAGYFDYFGAAAGDPTTGYYSYEMGAWQVVVLNTNCWEVGGCHAGSPQEQWLRTELANSDTRCTLAYAHHPRWSSGLHGSMAYVQPIWQALYDHSVEVFVAGHDHHYERFAPLDAGGRPDPERGVRQFVVGTGGNGHYPVAPTDRLPASEVVNDDTYGVITLTLHRDSYQWEFVPEAGQTFKDVGSGSCH